MAAAPDPGTSLVAVPSSMTPPTPTFSVRVADLPDIMVFGNKSMLARLSYYGPDGSPVDGDEVLPTVTVTGTGGDSTTAKE